MATPQKDELLGLSRSDLLELIREIRKPVKSDKEVAEEKQQELDREAMSKVLQQNEENKQLRQKQCSHMRPNGSTTAVYIADLNRLYCQACAKWIIPTQEPDLFNRLYQLAI